MKFFTTLALFAAGSLAAEVASPVERGTPTLIERDGATVSSAIASISNAVGTLSTAINNFQSINDAPGLQTGASAVLSAINAGNSAVAASTPLTNDEALPLAGQIQGLSSLINSTISTLISKKPTFDQAQISSIVLDSLNQQKTASQTFSQTVISKIPSALQGIAMNLSQPIIDSLNAGIAAYSGSSSGGGATTSASSASASASETGSSSPTVSIATHTSGIAAPTNVAGYAAYAMAAAAAVVAAV